MQIKQIYIDRQVANHPITLRICSRLGAPETVIESRSAAYEAVAETGDPVSAAKQTLLLTRNQGAFIRDCPGTRRYICCNYKILHIGTFCPMDCAYCILQTFFHPPLMQFFVNQEDLDDSIDDLFAQSGICRIGTGEYTDSLVWDPVYPISEKLITRFSQQDCCVLEIKTKTARIDHLLSLDHRKKTIMSWSLNTPRIIGREERGTAGLISRLEAAARCEARGYPLAFHFDPMVIYPGCTKEYEEVVDLLFSYISAENVVWVSLGALRFMPDLKPVIRKRFRSSKIVYGEFIRGCDGKMRYFKPLRIELYRRITARLRNAAPNLTIYFCMEDDEVWKKSMGFTPAEKGGLPNMLADSARRHCRLRPE